MIAAQVDDAWQRFAKLIGGDAYAADKRMHEQAGRNVHRSEILAKVQTIGEVLADPQTLARDMLVEQEHPLLGKIRLPNLPFLFSDCDISPRGPAPLLGQHNREIAASSAMQPPRSMRSRATVCCTLKRQWHGCPENGAPR